MNTNIYSINDIIEMWPTRQALADYLGIPLNTLISMKSRNSVGKEYLYDLYLGCVKNGYPVTAEDILRVSASDYE